ncbi:sugar transferase [uncultured Haemophilus sp.]|uniref:sugar transferase n=1 Tax=uncultured Haemophilus sp. TaxID=237779 RepID=UPI002585CEB1|nr:sugar transferase [uncultured Haemophilus sp.]
MNKFLSAVVLILIDVISIFISIFMAVSLRKILNLFFDVPVIDYSYLLFVSVYITFIFILGYFGVYTKRFDFWHETRLVVKSSFLSFAILLAGLMLGQNSGYYSRSTLVLIFLLTAIIIPISKLFVKRFLFGIGLWKDTAKVITDNENFKAALFEDYYLGYVKSSDSKHNTLFIDSVNLNKDTLNKIIEDNIRNSREIIFTPVLNGYDFSQANIYNMFNSRTNVFTLENKLLSKLNKIIKAAIDYMLVVCSIFFWGPVLILIAFWLKREEPKGDILFKQRRLGINGKEFFCYKFRTMHSDQSFMPKWLENHPEEKAYYEIYHKYMHDPRITKVGEFLRKTSLDELPQLLNVLRGEMSLIGPRPYMVIEKKDIGRKAPLVLAVKPGITGLWQVSGRSDIGFNERVEMDVWYMKNWSLWNDIVILLKTISTVLGRGGAR